MKKTSFLLVISLILIIACKDKYLDFTNLNDDYAYFSLKVGKTKIYSIQQIIIDKPSNVYDTLSWEQKEFIASQIIDNYKDTIFRTDIYTRSGLGVGWTYKKSNYSILKATEALCIEDNIKYIPLSFPIYENKTWDGNKYNRLDTLKLFSFRYFNTHQPALVGSHIFDSTICIYQKADSSLIHKYLNTEKYAKNLGMVYKKIIEIHSNQPDFDPTVPLEKRITTGYIYSKELLSYENN